jgi:hypothetical protein
MEDHNVGLITATEDPWKCEEDVQITKKHIFCLSSPR